MFLTALAPTRATLINIHQEQRIQTTCCATRSDTTFAATATEVATLIDDGAFPVHISIQQPRQQHQQATTIGITNATMSKKLPTLLPPVDDNYGHAADPTARTSASTVCTELQERISATTCSALAAASGSSAASAALWSFAAGRTGRRSSSGFFAERGAQWIKLPCLLCR